MRLVVTREQCARAQADEEAAAERSLLLAERERLCRVERLARDTLAELELCMEDRQLCMAGSSFLLRGVEEIRAAEERRLTETLGRIGAVDSRLASCATSPGRAGQR